MAKRGENPDAVASMMAQINSLPTASISKHADAIPVPFDILPGAYGALVHAARLRKIAPAAYARRAALAHAAHDLNLPLRELVAIDARMTRDTGLALLDPIGSRFGAWEIESLYPEFQ